MRKKLTILLSAVALLGTMATASERIPADVNGDGKVNTADVVEVYNFILNMRTASSVAINDFPAMGWIDDETIGTPDAGKTAWEAGDVVTLSLESPTFGNKSYALTYDGNQWNTDVELDFTYLANEDYTVSAVYAPTCVAGTVEYLVSECNIDEDKININFKQGEYSRLRIACQAGLSLTVATTGFTPAGATEEATEAYTLTTDENGNAFLYGIFAEAATMIVKYNDTTLAEHIFEAASEPGKSYAIDAMIIDAVNMTAEQLKEAVTEQLNNGKTNIRIKLAEDAGADMFSAITAALAADGIAEVSIDLTISGAKTVPELSFYADEYVNENWRAGAALRSITLTDATTIESEAFFNCAMTSFSAPNVIAIEGYYTLNLCRNLTDVYLPSVQTLESYVFGECPALKTISLPECVDLGSSTFVWCESLETVYAPKATTLGRLVFKLCTSLTKVTLGSVVSVNQYSEDSGLFDDANDTKNIELVLSSKQKVMTFDSSTKYWNATETDYKDSENHKNKSFIGYTFKSVTLQ